jgi:ABC-2 type transport system permease protein
MSVSIALAATGYGIMLAHIASTHEQAASFGTVSVIIMAALGGIWVPTFVMPELMRQISRFSPLNWGLEGFYDIILRGGGFLDIIPEISILLLFFLITFMAGLWFAGRNRY